jgi:transposase-like protein
MKKTYGSKFKSQVALEAIRGDKTIAEIAGEYNIHPNLVGQWKKKLMKEAAELFATKREKQTEAQYPEDELLRKIGQLNVEVDFLRKKYSDYLLRNGKS